MEDIKVDGTRWKDGDINFVVKEAIAGKKDSWKVLQSTVGSNYFGGRNKSVLKFLEMTGGQIRKKCAEHVADSAIRDMTTRGIQRDAMNGQRQLVIRNGKAGVSRIQQSLRRIKERGFAHQT